MISVRGWVAAVVAVWQLRRGRAAGRPGSAAAGRHVPGLRWRPPRRGRPGGSSCLTLDPALNGACRAHSRPRARHGCRQPARPTNRPPNHTTAREGRMIRTERPGSCRASAPDTRPSIGCPGATGYPVPVVLGNSGWLRSCGSRWALARGHTAQALKLRSRSATRSCVGSAGPGTPPGGPARVGGARPGSRRLQLSPAARGAAHRGLAGRHPVGGQQPPDLAVGPRPTTARRAWCGRRRFAR